MSCYHPLRAIKFNYPEPIIDEDGKVHKCKISFIKGEYDPEKMPYLPDNTEYLSIPCGRCIGCRLDYSRTWADRCMLEAEYHENNYFVTLTYDDDHLPEKRPGSPVHSLNKRDMQLFMKRLRKRFPDVKIRFFGCGEYGSKSMRPHYHLLLFGVPFEDLRLYKRDLDNNYLYFVSDTVSSLWPFGFHLITELTWETCAYTARYIVKKQKGIGAEVYEKYNYEPEFVLMSRKPGIAKQWFEDHKDIVFQSHYIPTKNGSKKIKSNKYFDNLFDIEYPEEMSYYKEKRKEVAEMNNKLKSNLTSLSYNDMLASEELTKEASIKSLKRKEL